MTYSDQELLAFLNGDLDSTRSAEIEQTMRVDRDLESRVMALDPVAGPVRDAMLPLPGKHILQDLERLVLGSADTKGSVRHWMKMAAVLVLGALIGGGVMWVGSPAPDDWRGTRRAVPVAIRCRYCSPDDGNLRSSETATRKLPARGLAAL